jgi:hypothetical protein
MPFAKMSEPSLHISGELTLMCEAITESFGILAAHRAGKSKRAVVTAKEILTAKLAVVMGDPFGRGGRFAAVRRHKTWAPYLGLRQ